MYKIKEIILRETHEICQVNEYVVYKQVIIKSHYAKTWKTAKTQLVVDITMSHLEETMGGENRRERMEKMIGWYLENMILMEEMIPINFITKYRDSKGDHLVMIFQSPITFQLKDYFNEQQIDGNEKQLHFITLESLVKVLVKRNSVEKVDMNGYGLGLFDSPSTPYPLIRLTPFCVLNEMIQHDYSSHDIQPSISSMSISSEQIKQSSQVTITKTSLSSKRNEQSNLNSNIMNSTSDSSNITNISRSQSSSNYSINIVVSDEEWKENDKQVKQFNQMNQLKHQKKQSKNDFTNEMSDCKQSKHQKQIDVVNELITIINDNEIDLIQPIVNYDDIEKELERIIMKLQLKMNDNKDTSKTTDIDMEMELSQYEILEKIGEGGYGKCYKVKDKRNGKIVCLKQSFDEMSDYLLKEKQIMDMCSHPHIVTCYGYSMTSIDIDTTGSRMGSCLLMEYCTYGNLNDYLQRRMSPNGLELDEIKSICGQIASGCIYLYEQFRIIHRDIKMENFLLCELTPMPIIKICDFGLSIKAIKTMEHGVGTPLYSAPEILRRESYDNTCDLYSLGIVLYRLVFGKYPFEVKTLKELITIYNNNEVIDLEAKSDNEEYKECCDLLKQLIVFEKEKRMQWDQFIHHPFIIDCLSMI